MEKGTKAKKKKTRKELEEQLDRYAARVEELEVEDLADDALEFALQLGAEVQVLRSPEARERIPTMAAILRYRL